MNSETVDLIATDPPFKKGRDFHATPGSLAAGASFKDRWTWEKDVQQEWVDRIADDWPAIKELVESAEACYGEDMAAFLAWMGIRLLEMRRVLKPTGSIYLHCDHTAGAYLKMLMDAVFGRFQFQNEIIWYYSGGGASKRRFARKHDTLLFYTKDKSKWTFNVDAVRVPHKWVDGQKRADGSERDPRGKIPDDVIEMHGVMPWAKERTGFNTQKPLALYERFIRASSNEGDMVLDPFCGCATTCVAAHRLNRQWTGIDIWEGAHGVVLDRLEQEGMAADDRETIFGTVHYSTDVPIRTDDEQIAAPKMKRRKHFFEEPPDGYTNAQRKVLLVEQNMDEDGYVYCDGCDRSFDSPEYLQLDHNTPRSSGGSNNISNRRLLCGPCNRRKSNTLTLVGLRRRNKKEGFMADSPRAPLPDSASVTLQPQQRPLIR